MVKSCVAYNCQNKGQSKNQTVGHSKNLQKISFFSFPLRNKERCKLWVDALKFQDWTPTKSSRICSQHFSNDSFYECSRKGYSLKEDAVPSIFDFPPYLTEQCLLQSPEIKLELHCGLNEEVHNTDKKVIDVKQQQSHVLKCSHCSPSIVSRSGIDEHVSDNEENDLRQSPLSCAGCLLQSPEIKLELYCGLNEGGQSTDKKENDIKQQQSNVLEYLLQSPEIKLELHCGLNEEVCSTDKKENVVKQQQSNVLKCSHYSPSIVLRSGIGEHVSDNEENDLRQSPLSCAVFLDRKRSIFHDHNYEYMPRTQIKRKNFYIDKLKKDSELLRRNKYNKEKQVARLRHKIKSLEGVIKLLKQKQ